MSNDCKSCFGFVGDACFSESELDATVIVFKAQLVTLFQRNCASRKIRPLQHQHSIWDQASNTLKKFDSDCRASI